jgi:hypothetical protein
MKNWIKNFGSPNSNETFFFNAHFVRILLCIFVSERLINIVTNSTSYTSMKLYLSYFTLALMLLAIVSSILSIIRSKSYLAVYPFKYFLKPNSTD